jgi:hypothetical protein
MEEKCVRDYLVNGVFGVVNSEKKFVVVGDKLIYQMGGWDEVSLLSPDGYFTYSANKVNFICKVPCFNAIEVYEDCTFGVSNPEREKVIYERYKREPKEMSLEEIEEELGYKVKVVTK